MGMRHPPYRMYNRLLFPKDLRTTLQASWDSNFCHEASFGGILEIPLENIQQDPEKALGNVAKLEGLPLPCFPRARPPSPQRRSRQLHTRSEPVSAVFIRMGVPMSEPSQARYCHCWGPHMFMFQWQCKDF